jgi:hypothetical protein
MILRLKRLSGQEGEFMKHKVYKVVTYSKEAVDLYYDAMRPPTNTLDDTSLVFRSSNMVGEAALTYQIGKETRSDTPIFTFTKWGDALAYAGDFSPVLVGESNTAPYFLRDRVDRVLSVVCRSDLTRDEINTFWSIGSIPVKNPCIPSHFPLRTTVVYDFTPTAILYRGSLECVYGRA